MLSSARPRLRRRSATVSKPSPSARNRSRKERATASGVRPGGSSSIRRCRTSTLRSVNPVAARAAAGIRIRGAAVAENAVDSPGSFRSAPATVNSAWPRRSRPPTGTSNWRSSVSSTIATAPPPRSRAGAVSGSVVKSPKKGNPPSRARTLTSRVAPPASGKTTIEEKLCSRATADACARACASISAAKGLRLVTIRSAPSRPLACPSTARSRLAPSEPIATRAAIPSTMAEENSRRRRREARESRQASRRMKGSVRIRVRRGRPLPPRRRAGGGSGRSGGRARGRGSQAPASYPARG